MKFPLMKWNVDTAFRNDVSGLVQWSVEKQDSTDIGPNKWSEQNLHATCLLGGSNKCSRILV